MALAARRLQSATHGVQLAHLRTRRINRGRPRGVDSLKDSSQRGQQTCQGWRPPCMDVVQCCDRFASRANMQDEARTAVDGASPMCPKGAGHTPLGRTPSQRSSNSLRQSSKAILCVLEGKQLGAHGPAPDMPGQSSLKRPPASRIDLAATTDALYRLQSRRLPQPHTFARQRAQHESVTQDRLLPCLREVIHTQTT